MADQSQSDIIKANPIGNGLSAFRDRFNSICKDKGFVSDQHTVDRLGEEDLQILSLVLLSALQVLPAARFLRSSSGRAFFGELSNLNAKVTSDDFDLNRAKPLLKAALADDLDDELIWRQVGNLVIEATPPPRSIASSRQQTPWLHNTSSFANSSEHRTYVDGILKEELGTILLAQPNTPMRGSAAVRKLDVGFVDNLEAGQGSRYDRKQILVPGELKSNPFADTASKAWLDLGSLDITTATNYRPGRQMPPSNIAKDAPRKGRSSTSRKRPSSQTDSALPPSKRSCSVSPTKATSVPPNRVHRRIILQDYGKPIYKASSRSSLLAALVGCIEGHESLYKAGILHRDISIKNLMINEDSGNPSWPAFLIDLDLAIREQREGASGAKGKTGTRAFMAIGAMLGEQHSFMHDLESFFWVLFWICIHYDADGKDVGPTEFDGWNYESDNKLVRLKKGEIIDEEDFLRNAGENFTSYYQPLIPWVNRLRKGVFPRGERWKTPEPELYSSMKKVLHDAQKDPEVVGDR
ncbi:serine threonine-protein kinase sgk2 [Colletotrichum chrysophilum]|uniref:non-specific serine/threonine protein kinase n=1 Tax=Colletotrichum chrysophilum TaxID=1836956 RepID=A0AAD9AES2_9PEZI|nr:serine threonine-protein kinase sgk2 [Colletotrichum chrysophilum]